MALNKTNIIEKWLEGQIIDWRLLSTLEKKEWLLACLFRTGLPKGNIAKKDFVIEGGQVKEPVDLYCLLGEIFAGEKGYVGQDLDGLEDCLVDFKVVPGTVLTIKSHKDLADCLDKGIDNYFILLTEILEGHGFKLRLE
jgi:hypothetical protein